MTILDAGTGLPYRASNPGGEPRAYVLDPKTGKPRRAAEIGYFPDSPDAFCATSDASDSCRIPQELFYPEKGYGKFINIGRTGVFFNNWHVLLTLHDRNGEGKQFRWVMEQFMALNTEQSASDRPNGVNSMIVARSGGIDPKTGSSATDNREYLSGFYTFPKNGVFGMNLEPVTSTNINQWVQDADKKTYTKKVVSGYDSSAGKIVDYPTVDSFSIDQTKGIPIKCSDPGGIVGVFVPGKPQVEWSGNSSEGAGQLFWQRGMEYKMPDGTSQFLSCENPWMNPMDDGELGRLTYIGKNFVQYYIPPELGLKNPYFQKNISDFYPGGKCSSVDINDTNAVTIAYEQMGRDLGMPSDATQEMIREEFALRWVEASLIYGDNGQHSEIKSWPWGTQATATANITAGVITSITLTNPGVGYSFAPAVTIENDPDKKNSVAGFVDAKGEAVLNTLGKVTAIRYTNSGAGYATVPTVTIDPPAAVGFATGNYQYKEMVRGVGSGTTAFVQEWDFDDRILKVTNPDGNFIVGEAVVGIGTTQNGSDAKYIVKTVSTQDDTDAFNENTPFETEANEILDFSEINPFGEF